MQHPGFIDTHANQKHNKLALYFCCHAVFVNHRQPHQK
jgi:hypothetical protein